LQGRAPCGVGAKFGSILGRQRISTLRQWVSALGQSERSVSRLAGGEEENAEQSE